MSCRPLSMSTHRNAGSTTRCFDRRFETPIAALLSRAGPTRCALCTPGERIYTFWKYFRNAFARNAGLRIDHLLLSPAIAGRLIAAAVDKGERSRARLG